MKTVNRIAMALLLATTTLAAAQSAPAPAPQPKPVAETRERPQEATPSTYKLEYNIYETEAGKRLNQRSYTLLVTDNTSSQIRTGSRVPITTSASPTDHSSTSIQYQDIGIRIEARLVKRESPSSSQILMTNIEMSSIAPEQAGQAANPIIRSSRAESNTVLVLRKPTLLANIDDSLSKRSYQVEVTITQQ
jgi:hypothetical protein